MVKHAESTPENAAEQASGPNTPTEQVNQALVNQGDTVRASWPFSLDTITANTAYMRPEARELLRWVFTWCIDAAHPIRMEEFADRIGYSKSVVYKAYSGKMRHPSLKTAGGDPALMDLSADMIKAMRSFKRIEQQRAKLGRRRFVMTPTAKRVYQACDLARESQTPVFIEGSSHIGKTEAFRQYCIDNNHGKSLLIELEGVNGLHGLIKAVAVKLGIGGGGNAADLLDRIKRALTSDMVLIFDEMHLLAFTYRRASFFACVEFIRRLYDHVQCGVVLSFTKLGFQSAEKDRKRELEQIFRRGVHRMNLGDMPTVKDIEMIVEAWELEMPARADSVEVKFGNAMIREQPYAMLAQLSREQGLKAITERLRYAAKFAADRSEDLSWEDVVMAHLSVTRNATTPEHGWQH